MGASEICEKRLQSAFLSVAKKACCEYNAIVSPQKKPCPDMWFGSIKTLSVDNAKPIREGLRKTKECRVVLVLESPHVREYKDITAIRPIQGQTGKNLEKMLLDVLGEQYSEYQLFVVNAIRYQCSQGLRLRVGMNGEIKDFVFGNLLRKESFKNDLIGRLGKIYRPNTDIVINACTDSRAWNLNKGNKDMVRDLLRQLCMSKPESYHELPHPAVWKSGKLSGLQDRFKNNKELCASL